MTKFLDMKSELFAQILNAVVQVTELKPEQILSKTKTDDLVAARSLFVQQCVKCGLPSISIAEFLSRKKPNIVNRYLSSYSSYYKTSYYFREMDSRIASILRPQLSQNSASV